MKNFFSLICAFLCTIVAFAQEEVDYMTFSPKSETELSTLDTTIKATLTDEASGAAAAMVQTIGGFGSGQYAPDTTIVFLEDEEGKSVIKIPLTSDLWGKPYFENYYLQVFVALLDADFAPIETEDGDIAMSAAAYTCKDEGDARLEMTFPSQENIDNEMYTISQAYQKGIFTAYFSKEVTFDNASGNLSITGKDGDILAYAVLELESAEWSEMDGLYKVDFKYIPDATFSESAVAEMDITIDGIFYDETEMMIPEIVLFPASSSYRAPMKEAKSKLASDMSVKTDGLKVFNIQGNLIQDNATQADVNALPTGLYIVNGKKVLVK